MENVTPNVCTTTDIRGCNPSYRRRPSTGWSSSTRRSCPPRRSRCAQEAEAHGPIRFVVNTEHHVDHIFGNYCFKGAGEVVHHQGVEDNFMVPTPDLDSFDYALEAIPTDDPEGAASSRTATTTTRTRTRRPRLHRRPDAAGRRPHLPPAPHPRATPRPDRGHVPEERVVFTGDTVFSECQTWLMASDVDQWLAALDRDRAASTWTPSSPATAP